MEKEKDTTLVVHVVQGGGMEVQPRSFSHDHRGSAVKRGRELGMTDETVREIRILI